MPTSDGWCPFAAKRAITAATNFESGRQGLAVKAVVLHIGEGPLSAFFPTFNNPARRASAHFTVGKQGEIEQYVSINDTAYANGLRWEPTPSGQGGIWRNPRGIQVMPAWRGLVAGINPNYYTISIEHEGFFGEPWTEPMYLANLRLLRWIADETGIRYVHGETLIGHADLDAVDRANCPGPNTPWDRMMKDLAGQDEVARAALIAGANQLGISLNDQAALARYAIQNRLGVPLTNEFQFAVGDNQYVGQVWSQAVVFVKVGDWANVQRT